MSTGSRRYTEIRGLFRLVWRCERPLSHLDSLVPLRQREHSEFFPVCWGKIGYSLTSLRRHPNQVTLKEIDNFTFVIYQGKRRKSTITLLQRGLHGIRRILILSSIPLYESYRFVFLPFLDLGIILTTR